MVKGLIPREELDKWKAYAKSNESKTPPVNYAVPKDMAYKLDIILGEQGTIHGIKSRNDLIVRVLSHFIGAYFHKTDRFVQALSKTELNEILESKDYMKSVSEQAVAQILLDKWKRENTESVVTDPETGEPLYAVSTTYPDLTVGETKVITKNDKDDKAMNVSPIDRRKKRSAKT